MAPYLGGEMTAAATIQTKPTSNHWVSVFVCLQDADTPEWDGYELRAMNVNGGADTWQVWRVDDGDSTLLAQTSFEITAGGVMLLRRVGLFIEFWWKPPGGSWIQRETTDPDLFDTTYRWGMIGAGGTSSGALDNFSGGSSLSLLDQYAPELRGSALDTFKAGSAAMMTDNIGTLGANQLISDGAVIAQPDWSEPNRLSLNYLDSSYPPDSLGDGRESSSGDFLDAVNDSRTADAQRMQDDPIYKNVIYGRFVAETGGRTTLQYWLFYYFNWHPALTSEGDHEGDWEMVQFELDSKNAPIRSAYSQHDGGEVCSWSFTEHSATGRPVVYVARGTHASYFRPGAKPGQIPVLPDNDYADGDAPPQSPSVADLEGSAPNWLDWVGRWGGSTGGLFPSPIGPKQQGAKWSPSPASWADDQQTCFEIFGPSSSRVEGPTVLENTATTPPAPRIKATRVGARVRVQYSFDVWPGDLKRRPVTLVVSAQSRGKRFAPFMKIHRIRTRRGIISQPLGLGKAPFRVLVAAYTREGVSSATVTVEVRGSD